MLCTDHNTVHIASPNFHVEKLGDGHENPKPRKLEVLDCSFGCPIHIPCKNEHCTSEVGSEEGLSVRDDHPRGREGPQD